MRKRARKLLPQFGKIPTNMGQTFFNRVVPSLCGGSSQRIVLFPIGYAQNHETLPEGFIGRYVRVVFWSSCRAEVE